MMPSAFVVVAGAARNSGGYQIVHPNARRNTRWSQTKREGALSFLQMVGLALGYAADTYWYNGKYSAALSNMISKISRSF